MTKTNPRKIDGPWADGHVLDLHSTGSEFLGAAIIYAFALTKTRRV